MALIKNHHYDYYDSLHTHEIQRGDYMKINDNIIQFDFERRFGISMNSNLKTMDDDEIKEKKDEVNRM